MFKCKSVKWTWAPCYEEEKGKRTGRRVSVKWWRHPVFKLEISVGMININFLSNNCFCCADEWRMFWMQLFWHPMLAVANSYSINLRKSFIKGINVIKMAHSFISAGDMDLCNSWFNHAKSGRVALMKSRRKKKHITVLVFEHSRSPISVINQSLIFL